MYVFLLSADKEDEIGEACSTHGGDKNAYKISSESLKRTDHSEDQGVDGRIILEWILGK
jgi:hypothetical protein